MRVAEAQLTKAEERAGYAVVRAPFGGIVTRRHVERGESVSPGQPLISGFLPDQLRVSVEVPQRLIGLVRQHRTARVLLPDEGRPPLNVGDMSIFPYASQGTGTTRVRLNLPFGVEGLSPGMLVKVSFATGERSVLVIPARAVVYRSEVIGVYVQHESGAITLRRIRPGESIEGDRTVVLTGLEEGERIVLDPVAAISALRQRSSK